MTNDDTFDPTVFRFSPVLQFFEHAIHNYAFFVRFHRDNYTTICGQLIKVFMYFQLGPFGMQIGNVDKTAEISYFWRG
jgi:hypothetical protein